MSTTVYLIPSVLDEESIETVPPYVMEAVRDCNVFFVENERTARRFLKKMSRELVIDDYEWIVISKHANEEQMMISQFTAKLKEGKNIGIISEAGCPGVADPGQSLIAIAHQFGSRIKPLVGPSSILLALMASGLNGQKFQFVGYLPIEQAARVKAIKDLEAESAKKNCTQIFIETPYRNNQLLEVIVKVCSSSSLLCIAANLTAANEMISTRTIKDWRKNLPDLNKQPAIFCLHGG